MVFIGVVAKKMETTIILHTFYIEHNGKENKKTLYSKDWACCWAWLGVWNLGFGFGLRLTLAGRGACCTEGAPGIQV